jgi:hypothetical protein
VGRRIRGTLLAVQFIVLLGREEKVEGRAGRIHRPIKVAPLAFDPDEMSVRFSDAADDKLNKSPFRVLQNSHYDLKDVMTFPTSNG